MEILTFNRTEINHLLIHARNASGHASLPFSGRPPGTAEPALWLVSGQGIYLRSNGTDESGLIRPGPLAYALEAHPDSVPVQDWSLIKGRIFQGDGYIDLSLDSITRWLAQTFDTPRMRLRTDQDGISAYLLSDLEATEHDH